MTADRPRKHPHPAGPGRTSLRPGLAGLLSALLLLGACAHAKDELPRVVPPSSGPARVAAPVLPARSPAPCATTPPDIPAASPAPGNRYDDAAAGRVQQYLDAHPADAGSLIINATVRGSGISAGFAARWCEHRAALRRLVGGGTQVDVFAVAQPYRAGQRLADRIMAATGALGRAGIRIGTAGVDPRTGLTAVTSPDDPAEARTAILRELRLPADSPIMVSSGDLPIPANR